MIQPFSLFQTSEAITPRNAAGPQVQRSQIKAVGTLLSAKAKGPTPRASGLRCGLSFVLRPALRYVLRAYLAVGVWHRPWLLNAAGREGPSYFPNKTTALN